jgi:metal-responsive CopG/Arc/MetJ family transcriptional regulator
METEITKSKKVKISITISPELLETIDSWRRGNSTRRSPLIEAMLQDYIERLGKDAREAALLTTHAARYRAEAEDVLEYQIDIWELGDDIPLV